MKTKCLFGMRLAAAAGFFTMALAVVADDIQTYSIPKGHPPIPQQATAPATAPDGFEVNAAPVHWTAPAGWKQLPATAMRIGNFIISGSNDKKAEVAVTSFPGSVGTELDNVNRWRRELALEVVDPAGIVSQAVTVDGQEGKQYEFAGAAARIVVVSLPRGEATWFFKLRGDKEVVDGAKAAFQDFLKSVRFGGEAMPMPAQADPHAGVLPTDETTTPIPNWNPPSTWSANQPGPMVVKSFSIAGEAGQKASVAVSMFAGDVGGTFANVNRWRSQMGLAPIQQADVAAATEPLKVEGGTAVLVDLGNPNIPAGRPNRLVAAIVPHNGSTWFYKLTGDDSVVAREKDGFVKFVQTVRYP